MEMSVSQIRINVYGKAITLMKRQQLLNSVTDKHNLQSLNISKITKNDTRGNCGERR